MKIARICLFAFYLNDAIASQAANGISFDEITELIDTTELFNYLKARFPSRNPGGVLSKEEQAELMEEWGRLNNAATPSDFGLVHESGLSLLMAYVIESIKMRDMN